MEQIKRIIKSLMDIIFFFIIGMIVFIIIMFFFIIGMIENAMSRK